MIDTTSFEPFTDNRAESFAEMTTQDQEAFHPIPNFCGSGLSPAVIQRHFDDAVRYVCEHIDEYVNNPGKDFSRNTVFNCETLIRFLILMGNSSSICELNKFFSMDKCTLPPHNSTFCQARQKLDPEALYAVFRHFTDSFSEWQTFKGYRLIGVDGSTINIPLNMKEPETLHQNKENQKHFSQCYFNGAYDLLNAVYVDTLVSTLKKTDERSALLEMAARTSIPEKSVFAADRGYGGWRVYVSLNELDRKFIIREKDKDSQGTFAAMNLSEEEEFDIVKTIILTNKQTKETLGNPDLYRLVMSNQNFPYLDKENHYYALKLRFVRKKVAPNKYICLITNLLDQEEITIEDLQYAYFLRWGHEGAYRIYKYTIGVLNFHSKKYANVQQEIYAKMVEFNVCQMIAGCVPMDDDKDNRRVLSKEEYLETCKLINEVGCEPPDGKDESEEHDFEIGDTIRCKPNLAAAITNIKQFLSGHGSEERLILRIKRYLIPIRPGRSFARNVKPQSATTLLYRAA